MAGEIFGDDKMTDDYIDFDLEEWLKLPNDEQEKKLKGALGQLVKEGKLCMIVCSDLKPRFITSSILKDKIGRAHV